MKRMPLLFAIALWSLSFIACEKKEMDFSDSIPTIDKCSFYGYNSGSEDSQIYPFSSSHKMKYTLNDYYKKNDYYEAVFRSYENIIGNNEEYEIEHVDIAFDELIDNCPEHYHFVVMDTNGACLPDINEDCGTLIFDVETGDYWAGIGSQNLCVYGKCLDDNYDVDSQLISYVEGYWEFPEYDNIYEYLASMDWLKTNEDRSL